MNRGILISTLVSRGRLLCSEIILRFLSVHRVLINQMQKHEGRFPDINRAAAIGRQTMVFLTYERELAKALESLGEDFKRWRKTKISAFELSELIHKFHNGIARDLWSFLPR